MPPGIVSKSNPASFNDHFNPTDFNLSDYGFVIYTWNLSVLGSKRGSPLLFPWRCLNGIRKPLCLWKKGLFTFVCASCWLSEKLKKKVNSFSLILTRTLQVGRIPEAQCISHCNCFNSSISPVCGSNGVTYLSACFAGCTSRNAQEPTGRSGSSITQVTDGFVILILPFFLCKLSFVFL